MTTFTVIIETNGSVKEQEAKLCSIERGSIQCTNQNGIMHLPKIRFLFPVSFTVEYKVGIAEFYLLMGSDAELLKDMLTRALKLPKSESAHL